MSPEVFQLTVMEHHQADRLTELETLVRGELAARRVATRNALDELAREAEPGLRRRLFSIMIADGGKDLLAILMTILKCEPVPAVVEQMLGALSGYAHADAIPALEAFAPFVPDEAEGGYRRGIAKLETRFPVAANQRRFREAEGDALDEVVEAMSRVPDKAYVPFLNRFLAGDDLDRIGAAARVLRATGDGASFAGLVNGMATLADRVGRIRAFLALPFMAEGARIPTPRSVVGALAVSPVVAWSETEKTVLSDQLAMGTEIALDHVATRFGFSGGLAAEVTRLLDRLVNGGDGDAGPVREGAWERLAMLRAHLEDVALALGRTAKRTGREGFTDALAGLLPETLSNRETLIAIALRGYGDNAARERLLGMLADSTERALTLELLGQLGHFSWDGVPSQILDLASQDDDGELRRAALASVATAKQAPHAFEKLLANAPVVVRADVGATIAAKRLKACYPVLMGFLHRPSSDRFRAIVLETLSAFDSEETGLAVQGYAAPPHALVVREAALATLLHAGGGDKMGRVIGALTHERDRHRGALFRHLLRLLRSWAFPAREAEILSQAAFWSGLLDGDDAEVRMGVLDLLSRMAFRDPSREGWNEILQRALNTLQDKRSPEEQELIRALIAALAARFASEREAGRMRAQLAEAVKGMSGTTRQAKMMALRKLDWVFRPEMLTGDPELVRKLVGHIERFLDDAIDDNVLEILAIEVAGKIGHPFLRRKLEAYVDHENQAIARAAKRALARPVNEAMLENMVRTVFSVDDSAYMTRTVTTILSSNGYEPRGENDIEAAFLHLSEKRYDLLILDLNMPAMRGVDFLRTVRERDICPRFVFILTSVRTHEDLIEVFKEGVDGIILKPFRAQDLLEKIAELKERCA